METSDKGLVDIKRFDLEPERPIFHGLIEDLDPERLGGLSTEDKVPYVVKIIGEKTVSSRMIASMVEVGQSIKTWPQLASAEESGGGFFCGRLDHHALGQFPGFSPGRQDIAARLADRDRKRNRLSADVVTPLSFRATSQMTFCEYLKE